MSNKQQQRMAAALQAEANRQQAVFSEADRLLTEALTEAEDLASEAQQEATKIILDAQKRAQQTILPYGKRPLSRMLSKLDVNHLKQIAEVAQQQIEFKQAKSEQLHRDLLAVNRLNKMVADLLSQGYEPRQINKTLRLPRGYSEAFIVNK